MTSYMSFGFDNCIVEFPKSMKHKIYYDGYCNGIIFYDRNCEYELSHNNVDWNRLIISDNEGWRDLPFNEGTWKLLPDTIKIWRY